jgi:uncharacterized membrane protein
MHGEVMLAIALMTVVTVALRLGGYFMMSYVTVTPRVRRMLGALPGSVITAAVLPVALAGGTVAMAAVAVAMLAMLVTKRDIIAVIAGSATAALLRLAGFAG